MCDRQTRPKSSGWYGRVLSLSAKHIACNYLVDLDIHYFTQNTAIVVQPEGSMEEIMWHDITITADNTKDHGCYWKLWMHDFASHLFFWKLIFWDWQKFFLAREELQHVWCFNLVINYFVLELFLLRTSAMKHSGWAIHLWISPLACIVCQCTSTIKTLAFWWHQKKMYGRSKF